MHYAAGLPFPPQPYLEDTTSITSPYYLSLRENLEATFQMLLYGFHACGWPTGQKTGPCILISDTMPLDVILEV